MKIFRLNWFLVMKILSNNLNFAYEKPIIQAGF